MSESNTGGAVQHSVAREETRWLLMAKPRTRTPLRARPDWDELNTSMTRRFDASFRVRRVGLVRVLRFEVADRISRGHADQQGQRELDPVVRVKLQLGEQVCQRNTDEHAGRKGQGGAPDG